MNKKIKIAFAGWWSGFNIHDNFITKALDNKIEYTIVENSTIVDFVFCSLGGHEYLKFTCPRIFFTGENCVPDFNVFDYGIGFEFMDIGDRYYRYPLYALCENFCSDEIPFDEAIHREFCSMVVSHGTSADPMRDAIYDALCEYKTVASGGRYRNNIGKPDGVEDKSNFVRKYKFNLACENTSHPGYCTEKLIDAFSSGVVPIYWGDPNVDKYFNPNAFINANRFATINELVDFVKKVDNDDTLYYKILNEKKITQEEYLLENMDREFSIWLCNIVMQDKENAYRRNRHAWALDHEKGMIANFNILDKAERKKNRKWKCIIRTFYRITKNKLRVFLKL